MFDDLIDNLISRLVAGAGLIMAAAIAAVAAAMAVFAFLSQWIGPAWAYVVVATVATIIVTSWSLLQRRHRALHRPRPLDERVLEAMRAHPTASFMAGLAAATLLKGKPSQAAALWNARKGRSG